MSKFKTALSSIASKLTQVDIGGMTAYCIKSPSEAINIRSILAATDYQMGKLPPSEDDDLPVHELDESLKNIQAVVGKIRTQRQRNAAVIGLQQATAFRAIFSLVDVEGKRFVETDEEISDMLDILTLEPELIEIIEKKVGWDEFSRKKEDEAAKEAAKPKKDGPKLDEEVSPND